MNKLRFAIFGLAVSFAVGSSAWAQGQYIGYVYPAGGQQGTTFAIRLGGQALLYPSDVVVSGEGVSVRLVDYFRVLDNQELGLLRQQLNQLKKKETTVDDSMVGKMAWFEFPGAIGPDTTGPVAVSALICPVCGAANPLDATVCASCNANLEKPKTPPSKAADTQDEAPVTEQEIAKQNLIRRIESIFAEDERTPAVRSQTELVFAEVTIAPDAKPGRREIRVITKRGVSNALPFFVGQVPEVARKPMKTMQVPILGKEHLSRVCRKSRVFRRRGRLFPGDPLRPWPSAGTKSLTGRQGQGGESQKAPWARSIEREVLKMTSKGVREHYAACRLLLAASLLGASRWISHLPNTNKLRPSTPKPTYRR